MFRKVYYPVGQINESGEPNNYITVLFQGDVSHLAGDIQVRRITHDEKEKIQSECTADSKLKPSTGKRLLILKTDNLLAEIEQAQVDHLKASKIYHQKMPYHTILLSPLCRL